jgi:hypothetical protein
MTIKGGTGSGEVNERHSVTVLEGLQNRGFEVTTLDWIAEYEGALPAAMRMVKLLVGYTTVDGRPLWGSFLIPAKINEDNILHPRLQRQRFRNKHTIRLLYGNIKLHRVLAHRKSGELCLGLTSAVLPEGREHRLHPHRGYRYITAVFPDHGAE